MAIKKIEIRPKGTGTYEDVLYPKTSSDMVIDEASGKTVAERLANISSTASGTSIVDTKNFYTSNNVEGALEEIGQTISGANGLMITSLNAILGG